MDEQHRYTTDKEKEIYNEPTINIIAGAYQGAVRIIGGGSTMWADYNTSEEVMAGSDIIAVNMAGMVIVKATHLFSWHSKQIAAIKQWRRAEWPNETAIVHSVNKKYGGVDWEWRFNGGTSVSGLSAIDLAWLLGYRRIALVGIPMDGNGYFYKPNDNPDMHDKPRHSEVQKLKSFYKDAVRSFSGYTREIMGEPDTRWAVS